MKYEMNPITLTEIRENGPTLIILSIIPMLLVFSGLTLLTYFENTNTLFESVETSETLIIISIILYSLVGLVLYIMVGPYRGEKMAVVGTFIIAVLCVSVMMAATTSMYLNT